MKFSALQGSLGHVQHEHSAHVWFMIDFIHCKTCEGISQSLLCPEFPYDAPRACKNSPSYLICSKNFSSFYYFILYFLESIISK